MPKGYLKIHSRNEREVITCMSRKGKSKTVKVDWKVELDKAKMEKLLEFQQFVPKSIERPVRVVWYVYNLIFVDLVETIGTTAEILLSFLCFQQSIKMKTHCSRYIVPARNISARAS